MYIKILTIQRYYFHVVVDLAIKFQNGILYLYILVVDQEK